MKIENIATCGYISAMHLRMASRMLVIGWLTLLISAFTMADLVVDLVFEEPDVTVDLPATTEEPENAAEHLLMPSQRAGGAATSTALSCPVGGLDTSFIAGIATPNIAPRAVSPRHRPPRSSPTSFSVPLRI